MPAARSRSAIVRATPSTRWQARADSARYLDVQIEAIDQRARPLSHKACNVRRHAPAAAGGISCTTAAPTRASSSPRSRCSNDPAARCTRTSTAPAVSANIAARKRSSICSPSDSRRPRSAPTSCVCGWPPLPACSCTRCAARPGGHRADPRLREHDPPRAAEDRRRRHREGTSCEAGDERGLREPTRSSSAPSTPRAPQRTEPPPRTRNRNPQRSRSTPAPRRRAAIAEKTSHPPESATPACRTPRGPAPYRSIRTLGAAVRNGGY